MHTESIYNGTFALLVTILTSHDHLNGNSSSATEQEISDILGEYDSGLAHVSVACPCLDGGNLTDLHIMQYNIDLAYASSLSYNDMFVLIH